MTFEVAIVGGGISGLATALEVRRLRPDASLVVLEEASSAGGKVRSSSVGGYSFDWGPGGFQPAPQTLELVERLGLSDRLVPASPAARTRYLYRSGGLRRVPGKPPQFLVSELLSPAGKLRALLEPLLAGRVDGEESVFDFVARHFGFEAARNLAAPMVLGVTAGDAGRLSVDALFPAMRKLEREYGSLLKGMIARRKAARESRENASSERSSVATPLYTLAGGMGLLTEEMGRQLAGPLRTQSRVERVQPLLEGGFELSLAGGESVRAAKLILATPAYVSAELLEPFLPEASRTLAAIDYPPVDVFALGYRRIDVPHALDGFGFLVPRGQGVRSLGVLWPSSTFAAVAPPGMVLLRVICGGAVDRGFSALDDEAALAQVQRDLRVTMGVTANPDFSQRISFERAIPQYELGHAARVEQALGAARRFGGIVLTGNAYFGVGVNDAISDARRAAQEAVGGVAAGEGGRP